MLSFNLKFKPLPLWKLPRLALELLHLCAAKGSGFMMQHLLASEQIQVYCNANSCFKGQYPLHSAADTTNVQTARILIVNGASV